MTINPVFLLFGMFLCLFFLSVRKPHILAVAPGIFGMMVFAFGVYAAINWSGIVTTGQQLIATYIHIH